MGQEPSRGCPVTLACDLQNPHLRKAERKLPVCRALELKPALAAIWAAHSRDMP